MIEVRAQMDLGGFQLDAVLRAPAQGVTALTGPSGSGKTTLINIIAGLLRPTQGRVAVAGQALFDSDQGINLPPQRRRVGYVFQEARLFPHLTVRGNLAYGMPRGARRGQSAELAATAELLGLEALLQRRPARLSGGEKQRVAMGRALLAQPRLLLLDEPLASLDSGRKQELIPYIARLSAERDLPIIYVSHAADEISRLASYVVLMQDGKVAAAAEAPRHAAGQAAHESGPGFLPWLAQPGYDASV